MQSLLEEQYSGNGGFNLQSFKEFYVPDLGRIANALPWLIDGLNRVRMAQPLELHRFAI